MPGETLTFDIFANDRASETFRRLGLAADSASGDVKQLGDRLDRLGTRVTTARVELDGNKEANAELDKLDIKLIKLGNKVANPNITVEGKVKALADISAVDLAMDRLNKKFASPSGGRGGIAKALISGAAFKALFSGGGGGAGGAEAGGAAAQAGGGGIADFLFSPAGIGSIAGLLPILASLTDALAGFGVGAVGAAGAGGSVALLQPGALAPGLKNIKQTLSTVTQSFGPSLGLLTVQFGKFVQGLAPQMAKLFGATLPFFKSFLSFAEQAAKIALPALTQVMQQMVSSGALKAMTQGFVILVQALANFIKELGPGFKAGALIFRALAIGIDGLLTGLGATFGWLGKITGTLLSDLRYDWDTFRHDLASIFDSLVSGVKIEWGILWDNTITAVKDGIRTAVGFFFGFPPQVIKALFGLGHELYGFAHAALDEFLSGLKDVGSSILSWLDGFWHSIVGLAKKVLGVFSPSAVFFDIGKNLMVGLEHGIKSHAHRAVGAAQSAAGGVSGAVGGSVNSWIVAAIRDAHAPLSWLPALQRLVSLESGGNPRAVDPISVLGQHAEGLWQMLPSTFYSYGGRGSLFNPVEEGIAALRYIASRYGSPFNIPGLFSGGYQGYAGGGMITEPILGIGLQSGRGYGFGERGPEMVVPTRGAAAAVVIEFTGGSGEFDQFMLAWVRRAARVRGGGDVQLAFGRK